MELATLPSDRTLAATVVRGTLHCVVALDWGEEVDLERAAELMQSEAGHLPRRRRTPEAFAYRPAPLTFPLGTRLLPFSNLSEPAQVEAVVFDFGAANVAFRVPFTLPMAELASVAASLADQRWLLPLAKEAARPLYERLLSFIDEPQWSDIYED